MRRRTSWGLVTALVLALATGCSRQATPTKYEEQARETFVALEAALKAKDSEKIWNLLALDSQKDADRAAETLKATFLKADAREKAEQEKKLGLNTNELAGLTGRLFLKSNRFHSGEIEEIPGSTFEKATVNGDQATVHYVEGNAKREKETLKLVREDGKWKVALGIRAAP